MLHFGQTDLPGELGSHLEGCAACRTLWQELSNLKEGLGRDQEFHPSDLSSEQLCAEVDKKIREIEVASERAIPIARRRRLDFTPVAAAAALVLVVAAGLFVSNGRLPDLRESESATGQSDALVLNDVADEQPDAATVDFLIEDFTARHAYDASEWLLDDLTDEEIDYLERTFDVGNLL